MVSAPFFVRDLDETSGAGPVRPVLGPVALTAYSAEGDQQDRGKAITEIGAL
jgi:hypothetical protein